MSEKATNYELPSDTETVQKCVERLISETNEDIKNIRSQQAELHSHVGKAMVENEMLSSQVGKYEKMFATHDIRYLKESLKLSTDALGKSMKEVESLRLERATLDQMQKCSAKTIKYLETELLSYQNHIAQDDSNKLREKSKMLERQLYDQQENILKQASIIQVLNEHKKRNEAKIIELEIQLQEHHMNVSSQAEYESKISGLQKQIKNLEKSLQLTQGSLEKTTKREAECMRKVQEAIIISETAVSEKDKAEYLAKTYKEEVQHMTTVLSSVMDEAAVTIEAQYKNKLTEKDQLVSDLRDKLKEQRKKIEEMEESYRKSEMEKVALDNEFGNRKSKNRTDYEMKKYSHAFNELKSHYKHVMDDLSDKYLREIEKISKENHKLRTHNQLLINSAAGDYLDNIT